MWFARVSGPESSISRSMGMEAAATLYLPSSRVSIAPLSRRWTGCLVLLVGRMEITSFSGVGSVG